MATNPWDFLQRRSQTILPMDTPNFTPEELSRLLILRDRLQNLLVDLEMDLDMKRLRFARWLVEHGRLSDDIR